MKGNGRGRSTRLPVLSPEDALKKVFAELKRDADDPLVDALAALLWERYGVPAVELATAGISFPDPDPERLSVARKAVAQWLPFQRRALRYGNSQQQVIAEARQQERHVSASRARRGREPKKERDTEIVRRELEALPRADKKSRRHAANAIFVRLARTKDPLKLSTIRRRLRDIWPNLAV